MLNLVEEADKYRITRFEPVRPLSVPIPYHLEVLFVGATGAGKSSTINVLSKASVAPVGDIEPETQICKAYRINDYLTIWDSPGIGDSPQKDLEHQKKIRKLLFEQVFYYGTPLQRIDLVVVVMESHRKDLDAVLNLVRNTIYSVMPAERVLFVDNQVDILNKGRDWDSQNAVPEQNLLQAMEDRELSVCKRLSENLGKKIEHVFSYSALKAYRIRELFELIMQSGSLPKRPLYSNCYTFEDNIQECGNFAFAGWICGCKTFPNGNRLLSVGDNYPNQKFNCFIRAGIWSSIKANENLEEELVGKQVYIHGELKRSGSGLLQVNINDIGQIHFFEWEETNIDSPVVVPTSPSLAQTNPIPRKRIEYNRDDSSDLVKAAVGIGLASLGLGGCFITSAVCRSLGKDDDCEELMLLRHYRDDWLANQPEGPRLIEEYYSIAPGIVQNIDRLPNANEIYMGLYRKYIKPCVDMINKKYYLECENHYKQMVLSLEQYKIKRVI